MGGADFDLDRFQHRAGRELGVDANWLSGAWADGGREAEQQSMRRQWSWRMVEGTFSLLDPQERYTAGVENNDVTGLLRRWSGGDASALEALTPMVYAELRQLAHRHMSRESKGHTLQATALVNEAFLRLMRSPDVKWQDRAHFFAVSSQVIRRILVDHARQRSAEKRGPGLTMVDVDLDQNAGAPRALDLMALDDALEALAQLDPVQSRVVEMRFFGGLSAEEIACALGIAPRTVGRYWSTARLWLLRELRRGAK